MEDATRGVNAILGVCGREHLEITAAGNRRDPAPERLQDEMVHTVFDLVDEQGWPVMRRRSGPDLYTALETSPHQFHGKHGSSVVQANEQLSELAIWGEQLDARQAPIDLA